MIRTSGLTNGLDPIPFQLRNSSGALSPGPRVPGPGYQVIRSRALSILHRAYPMCGFGSVLGVRPSARIQYPVPDSRYPIPGAQYLAPAFEKTRTSGMHPVSLTHHSLPVTRHFCPLQPLCQSGGVSGSIRSRRNFPKAPTFRRPVPKVQKIAVIPGEGGPKKCKKVQGRSDEGTE